MNMKNVINEISERLDWSVDIKNNEFSFRKFSPAGKDFYIEITADSIEEMKEALKKTCDNFDCSEETYIWLDRTGHGTNGAPHDMKDLYEDNEACLGMMEELYEAIKEKLEKLEAEQEVKSC